MCYSLIKCGREFAFDKKKTTDKTRRKMGKMKDDDVIIFSCTTLTLDCAVDMFSNEKAKKSRNQKTWLKDWLRERDTKGAYANILLELRLNDHKNFRKHLRMYFCTCKA